MGYASHAAMLHAILEPAYVSRSITESSAMHAHA